jgi:hypothetical protein
MNHGNREISDAAGGHGGHGNANAAVGRAANGDFSVLVGGGATAGNSGHGFAVVGNSASRGGHGGAKGHGR